MEDDLRRRITIEPDKIGGAPAIRGLRMPVVTILSMFSIGMTEDEILDAYPTLERDDLRAALVWAIDAVEAQIPQHASV